MKIGSLVLNKIYGKEITLVVLCKVFEPNIYLTTRQILGVRDGYATIDSTLPYYTLIE